MRWLVFVGALLVIAMLTVPVQQSFIDGVHTITKSSNRSPIRINSDADFTSENGVVGGSGTRDDPYIISGWTIDTGKARAGIYIGNTTKYFVIENCEVYNATGSFLYPRNAVVLSNVTNGSVISVRIWDSWVGIYIKNSKNVTVANSNVTVYNIGVYVVSSKVTFRGNTISECDRGMLLFESVGSVIYNNTFRYNWRGIEITDGSFNNVIYENRFYGDGITFTGGKKSWTNQDIAYNNTVDNKPIYYVRNANMNNQTVPGGVGEVIVANVSWLKIENLNLGNVSDAIQVGYSTNITIRNNTINWIGEYGIWLRESEHVTIENNTVLHARHGGISLWISSYNTIANNTIKWSNKGLDLYYHSNYNVLRNNTLLHGKNIGVSMTVYSENNQVIYNLIADFGYYGIYISYSQGEVIYGNALYYNNGAGDVYNRNHVQAYDDTHKNNEWNTTDGGNYWHDWANNNDSNDQNGDGIVDWPYVLNGKDDPGSKFSRDKQPLKDAVYLLAPLPPQNINAKTGKDYVLLTWDPPRGNGSAALSGYAIYRNGVKIATVGSEVRSYNDTTVVTGNTYYYYVTAISDVGEGDPSATVQATPGEDVPELNPGAVAVVAAIIFTYLMFRREIL